MEWKYLGISQFGLGSWSFGYSLLVLKAGSALSLIYRIAFGSNVFINERSLNQSSKFLSRRVTSLIVNEAPSFVTELIIEKTCGRVGLNKLTFALKHTSVDR